jgi:DNA-binding transcriptional LysR family regulator
MKLTAAGSNLLKYADQILHLLDEAKKSTELDEFPKGPLRLGALETTAAVHMPPLLMAYREQYPEVKISLFTEHTKELLNRVVDYELDGAFVSGPTMNPDLCKITVFKEELVLISKPGEEKVQELLQKPLLFFSKNCSHRKRLRSWLKEESIPEEQIMEFGTLESILGGVSCGLGVSLLPLSTVSSLVEKGKIAAHRIPEPYRESVVQFVYRQDIYMTKAFEAFIRMLEKRAMEQEDHLMRDSKSESV